MSPSPMPQMAMTLAPTPGCKGLALPQRVPVQKLPGVCRGVITMEQPCMRAYSTLLIKTCHRRGIFAMGGMSAQIPVKNDPQANEAALQKVRVTPVDSWLT